jgi:PAS domain S-box-containing protein
MLVLAGITYTTASSLLRDSAELQLVGLVESKKEGLEEVIEGWRDRVRLIASRTQLRLSLRTYNETASAESADRIQRILGDALGSVATVESLTVYDPEGQPVASARRGPELPLREVPLPRFPEPGETVVYDGVSFNSEDEPRVSFVSTLTLEGERIGTLHVLMNAQELVDFTRSFGGLGETGETMIVMRSNEGTPHVLHPLRRGTQRPGSMRESTDSPASRALRGEEGTYLEGITDYRGEPVWAATRFLPETGWGLVVKFDAAEQRAPALDFRRDLMRLALSLSAIAILVGTLLGFRFAKPIHNLAEAANRIRMGELDTRAAVVRDDEIGILASTFNQMAEELERQVSLLKEFQKFFDLSLDMLCIAGTDGYFKRVNPAFERTLGWREEDLCSQPFVAFVHPDDVEATLREVEKLSEGIPTVSFENRYRCADGTYKDLVWTSYPEPETGNLYAVARDISELKSGA